MKYEILKALFIMETAGLNHINRLAVQKNGIIPLNKNEKAFFDGARKLFRNFVAQDRFHYGVMTW